jgi:hypothetical protein
MSKRLQVILTDDEFDELRSVAADDGVTVSDWVRRAVRQARRRRWRGDVEQRLAAVRAAARHDFPTADIDRMLNEIERGYRSG